MGTIAQDHTVLPSSKLNQVLFNTVKNIKKAKRILIIEDDSDMSKVLSKSLKENYNCIIDIAHDPFEAVNYIVDKFYDVIILDWQLPGLNGAETLLAAEKSLRFEPSIPIQWDTHQARVVILSSSEKRNCSARKTKHFNYTGYISKQQPLSLIIEDLGLYIENEKPQTSTNLAFNQMIKFS